MRIPAIISAVVIAYSPAAYAQESREAFYDAFKTFCADTGAKPDLVTAAVEATPTLFGASIKQDATVRHQLIQKVEVRDVTG